MLKKGVLKMPLQLEKKRTRYIINLVQDYMREGQSLECFLTDFDVSVIKWDKFVKRNKKLQKALVDGAVFNKAHWQRVLAKEMKRRNSRNTNLIKMAVENALGWTELAQKMKIQEKPRKMYKVYVDMCPEDGNEDKIVPEKKV